VETSDDSVWDAEERDNGRLRIQVSGEENPRVIELTTLPAPLSDMATRAALSAATGVVHSDAGFRQHPTGSVRNGRIPP
jgi:hypothetical protein